MRNLGFSLLEMLIVLVIFGIILSFAYPNYQTYMIRAHRLEGQIALLDLANRMEHYFAKYGHYSGATIGSESEHDVLANPETNQGYYLLSIQTATESQFAIQAIPHNIQADADLRCQSLQFKSEGEKSIGPGPGGAPSGTWEECWS